MADMCDSSVKITTRNPILKGLLKECEETFKFACNDDKFVSEFFNTLRPIAHSDREKLDYVLWGCEEDCRIWAINVEEEGDILNFYLDLETLDTAPIELMAFLYDTYSDTEIELCWMDGCGDFAKFKNGEETSVQNKYQLDLDDPNIIEILADLEHDFGIFTFDLLIAMNENCDEDEQLLDDDERQAIIDKVDAFSKAKYGR